MHEWLEGEEGDVGGHQKEAESAGAGAKASAKGGSAEWIHDEDRKPRSKEDMNKEAAWLREEMANDNAQDGGNL